MTDTSYETPDKAVLSPGGFVSFPQEFLAAPADLRNVVKVLHRPAVRGDALELEFSTDAVLLDFSGVEADTFDVEALIADCELVARAAHRHPDELRELVSLMQAGTDDGVQRALQITHRLGLTEEAATKAGGGLSLIVVVYAICNLVAASVGAKKNDAAPSKTGGG